MRRKMLAILAVVLGVRAGCAAMLSGWGLVQVQDG